MMVPVNHQLPVIMKKSNMALSVMVKLEWLMIKDAITEAEGAFSQIILAHVFFVLLFHQLQAIQI